MLKTLGVALFVSDGRLDISVVQALVAITRHTNDHSLIVDKMKQYQRGKHYDAPGYIIHDQWIEVARSVVPGLDKCYRIAIVAPASEPGLPSLRMVSVLADGGAFDWARSLVARHISETGEFPDSEPGLSMAIDLINEGAVLKQNPLLLQILKNMLWSSIEQPRSKRLRALALQLLADGTVSDRNSFDDEWELIHHKSDPEVAEAVLCGSRFQDKLKNTLAEQRRIAAERAEKAALAKKKRLEKQRIYRKRRLEKQRKRLEVVHFSDVHMNDRALDLISELDGSSLKGCVCAVTGDMDKSTPKSKEKSGRASRFFSKLAQCSQLLWVPGNHDSRSFCKGVFNDLDDGSGQVLHAAPWTKRIGDLLFLGVDVLAGMSDPTDFDLAVQLSVTIDKATKDELVKAGGYVVLTHFPVHRGRLCREQLCRLTHLKPTLVLYGHNHPSSRPGLPTYSGPDESGRSNLWLSQVVSNGKTQVGNRVVAQSVLWNGEVFRSERELFVNLRRPDWRRGWREAGTGDEEERYEGRRMSRLARLRP